MKDVSCQIFAGEVVVLCGQSGSGKSTLLNVLNGLIPELYPAEMTGLFKWQGILCRRKTFPPTPEKSVLFSKSQNTIFTTDVYSELAFTMENAGIEPVEIRKRIKEAAEQFSLSELLDASVFELSGGEKQRVAIACATMLSHDLFCSMNLPVILMKKHYKNCRSDPPFERAREDDRHCRAPIVLLDGDCGSLLITSRRALGHRVYQ